MVRRDGAENTFKGVLETVRGLINSQTTAVPPWLRDVFLVLRRIFLFFCLVLSDQT